MRHLKHWFIPFKHNDHRPHLIRRHGLGLVALVLLAAHGAAAIAQPPASRASGGSVLAYASDITPVDLFNLTNQERAANGLPALHLDARLNQSALLKAQNMFSEDYWAHVSPSGIQPWYWFIQAGYNYRYAGENLAKDFDTSAGAMDGWMNSPGHRANILNPNYTDVGFAVVNGTLVGGQTTLIVAHYGSPNTPPPAVATPATPKPKPQVAVVTPAPTPAPTVAPTPAPSQAPVPVASPKPMPTALVSAAAPAPKSYSLFAPLSLARTLAWPTILTLVVLALLLVVYVITHLAVWRKGLRRWRTLHYRAMATVQVAGLAAAILYLATSGLGSVG